MARNSSRNGIRILISIGIMAVFAYQQLQQTPETTKQNNTSKATQTKRSSSNNSSSPSPTTVDSNEGNLLLGNPSKAGTAEDNYLLERPQYSMSYNRSKGGPNWVAWHVDGGDLGREERADKFRPDANLPRDWWITPNDYKNSGYDRGHVCPSGDRTGSREANDATFYMSNMLPQTGELNRHVWADLEEWVRVQVRKGNEVYQIAGGSGVAGTIAKGKVSVPQVCWKVILILPEGKKDKSRITAKTRVIAVGIPNVTDKKLETADWRDYIVPASKIEKATKLDLFANLAPNIQKALESQVDSGS
jgi:endonuclease G